MKTYKVQQGTAMKSSKLAMLRKERGWTQAEAARRLGVSKAAYANIETGRRKPSYDVLVRLEDVFGKNHRELLGAQTPEMQKEPDGNPAENGTSKEYHSNE